MRIYTKDENRVKFNKDWKGGRTNPVKRGEKLMRTLRSMLHRDERQESKLEADESQMDVCKQCEEATTYFLRQVQQLIDEWPTK